MADAGVYGTNALVKMKAGTKASATSTGQTYTDEYLNEAEAFINCAARKVFAVDAAAFAALPATTRQLLTEIATDIAAIYAINWDLSGFTTRYEAEDMINVLRDRYMQAMGFLLGTDQISFIMTGVGF
jgi:hypothetical protein